MSAQVLEAINNLDEASLKELDPIKLIKVSSDLVKATAYKKNLDIKNQDMFDTGLEAVKSLVFESMAKKLFTGNTLGQEKASKKSTSILYFFGLAAKI